ncbi:Vacuolar protein sorting-associated protein 5, partial [Cladochytrium tenue]
FFVKRRAELDGMENQFRFLLKAVEALIKQRKELGGSLQEFADSVGALGAAEANRPAAQSAQALARVQSKIRDLHERQAKSDLVHVFGVVDEHVRVIGSIKTCFASRAKAFHTWQAAEVNLSRKKEAVERVRASAKIRQDKISVGSMEVAELEKEAQESQRLFIEVTSQLRSELVRYEREKAEDFAAGIQNMLRSMIETQKEVSEWGP